MMRPSLTQLVSLLFLIYIGNAIWTMAGLFFPATCSGSSTRDCITSHLLSQPKLQLVLFTSTTEKFQHQSQLKFLDIWPDVLLNETTEKNYQERLPVSISHVARAHWYLHVFLCTASPVSASQCRLSPWQSSSTTYTVTPILLLHRPVASTYSLLQDTQSGVKSGARGEHQRLGSSSNSPPLPHVRSVIPLLVLSDTSLLSRDKLTPDVRSLLMLQSATADRYLPVLHADSLASLSSHSVLIGDKYDAPVNFTVALNPASIGKYRLFVQFDLAMKSMRELGFTEKDLDDVKGLVRDTNLVLLLVTMSVTAIHLLFDFLAFKNDVEFWRRQRSLAGISTRAVVWRAFSQVVILLYLVDEQTSYLVIVPMAVGTVIEFWKVLRAFRVRVLWSAGFLPRLTVDSASAEEQRTSQLDSLSMRYLSFLLYPLCLAGAAYSLLYTPHKSWYSWCVQSTVNGVYAFGFLFMLPQLFLNYKLKSVAHLPWRALMYKAFNTFIDDLFAFMISMPTAHRVACFRDDAVFLVYLVQRWLYPVDSSRLDSADSFADDPGSAQLGEGAGVHQPTPREHEKKQQ